MSSALIDNDSYNPFTPVNCQKSMRCRPPKHFPSPEGSQLPFKLTAPKLIIMPHRFRTPIRKIISAKRIPLALFRHLWVKFGSSKTLETPCLCLFFEFFERFCGQNVHSQLLAVGA